MPAKCAPNADGAVRLRDILESFHAPIREEHAWALCYQCARCFADALRGPRAKCRAVTDVSHVWLHTDGSVHPSTIFPADDAATVSERSERRPISSEHELVLGLGVVIFNALDMGYSYGEEREISRDLEELIDAMTSGGDGDDEPHQETDDEGIERDSGEADVADFAAAAAAGAGSSGRRPARRHQSPSLLDVLEACAARARAASWPQAEPHYRAVCRALVAEALELSTFLERVSGGTRDLRLLDADVCRDLDRLNFQDWSNRRIWRALQARFWVQVIGELRMGVKLKKVDRRRAPIEYELTPYEILMDDIRSRRYKLNKIMVDGDVPQRVKKDAHALILEFIRSRPPLRRVADRPMPPPVERARTPREQLLDSIRRGRALRPVRAASSASAHRRAATLPQLRAFVGARMAFEETSTARATAAPAVTTAASSGHLTAIALTSARYETAKRRDDAEERRPTRRLIKVDFSVLQVDDDDDDDDDDGDADEDDEMVAAGARGADPYRGKEEHVSGGSGSDGGSPSPWRRTAYDLATQCPTRRASMRRHTLSTCGAEHLLGPPGTQSVPQSRPASRQSRDSSETDSQLGAMLPEMSWSRTSLQDELLQSKQWQEAMSLDDRLSLTLEEIVHIRSVLTKAELEALPVEGHVKEDAERRKICFLCLKTRFGIFGPWGQRCRLCKRTVCAKCHTKMRIPTEHFSNVPVVLLSPSLMSSPEEEPKDSFPRSLMARLVAPDGGASTSRNSVGSAPTSPSLQRGPAVLAAAGALSAPGSRVQSSLGSAAADSPAEGGGARAPPRPVRASARRAGSGADRLKGVQMIVCHDCKMMVLQIIKSSRTSRSAVRNNAIRNLTLNLSPVY